MYTLDQDFSSNYIAGATPKNSPNKYEYTLGLTRGIKVLPDLLSHYSSGPFVVSEKFINIFRKFNSTPFEINDVILFPRYLDTEVHDNDFNDLKSVFNLAKKVLGRTKFIFPIYNYKLIDFIELDLYDNYFLDYVDFKNSSFVVERGNPKRIIKDLPHNFKIETRADVKWLKEFRMEYTESFVVYWYKVVFKNFNHLELDIFKLPFSTNAWSTLIISDKFKNELEKNNITGFEYSKVKFGTEFIFT